MARYQWKYDKHKEITDKMRDLYSRKNEDYNDSFGQMFQELGPVTALTRIGDKFNRIKNLATKGDGSRLVEDETVEDTLMDMANYCIMAMIELEIMHKDREDERYIAECEANLDKQVAGAIGSHALGPKDEHPINHR